MTERSYLSIGDVLAMLSDEFPDITISKIRFLESRGLLDPERTPSGYRKFYEADVERLRWILRQQREHFLPLKVIKGRLEGGPADAGEPASLFDVVGPSAAQPAPALVGAIAAGVPGDQVGGRTGSPWEADDQGDLRVPSWSEPRAEASGQRPGRPRRSHPEEMHSDAGRGAGSGRSGAGSGEATGGSKPRAGSRATAHRAPVEAVAAPEDAEDDLTAADLPSEDDQEESAPEEVTSDSGPEEVLPASAGKHGPVLRGRSAASSALLPASPPPPARASAAEVSARARVARRKARRPTVETGASLTTAELADASGLSVEDVVRLEEFGLATGRTVAGVRCYDEEALVVARIAAGFARFGVEPRHLRTFKHAADREAGLFEQLVIPLLRQRNPEARAKANEALAELTELGAALQAVLLSAALRDVTG